MLPSVTTSLRQRLDGVALEPIGALARLDELDQLDRRSKLMSTPISAGDFVLKKSRTELSFSASMAASGANADNLH